MSEKAPKGTSRRAVSWLADLRGGAGKLSRSDMRLVRRAARAGWAIPPRLRQALVKRLAGMVDQDQVERGAQQTAPRSVVMASRTLAALGRGKCKPC
jgi:hypothetical protein